MGFMDGVNRKINMGLARTLISKLIGEHRLVFLVDDKVSYTEKDGRHWEGSIDKLATMLMDKAGRVNMESVGISDKDIAELIKAAKK